MEYILRTHHLVKCFKGIEVIKDVSIKMKKGEVYGFLGPNGAGKSTVMKMIMNLVQPTSGSVEIFNEEISVNSSEYLKRVSAIIENPIFYEKLTARENLELHCEYMGYHQKRDIEEILRMVNLRGIKEKAVGHFSLGMKQRLAIARAILTKPEILILDEPINGLDPEGIAEMRDLIKLLSSEYGMSIMISSHILGEIEQIADTVGIINEGRLVEEMPIASIHHLCGEFVEVEVGEVEKTLCILEDELKVKNMKLMNEHTIRIYDQKASVNSITEKLVANHICLKSISEKKMSLEDYFLKITKEEGNNA